MIRPPVSADFALAYAIAKGVFKVPRLALNIAMASFLARRFPELAAVRVSRLLDPFGKRGRIVKTRSRAECVRDDLDSYGPVSELRPRASPLLSRVPVFVLFRPYWSQLSYGLARPRYCCTVTAGSGIGPRPKTPARGGGAPLVGLTQRLRIVAWQTRAEALRQADRYGLALLLSKNLMSPAFVVATFGVLRLGSNLALVQGLVRRGADALARTAERGLPFAGAVGGGEMLGWLALTRVLSNLLYPLVFFSAARYTERRQRTTPTTAGGYDDGL